MAQVVYYTVVEQHKLLWVEGLAAGHQKALAEGCNISGQTSYSLGFKTGYDKGLEAVQAETSKNTSLEQMIQAAVQNYLPHTAPAPTVIPFMQSTPGPFAQLDPEQNGDEVHMDHNVLAYQKTLQLPMLMFDGACSDDTPNKFICAMNIYFKHEYELTGKQATACQKAVMAAHTLKGDAKSAWDTAW